MITENLSTLKIHKLSQAQYDREKEAGNLDETALYLTPDTEVDLSQYATKTELEGKVALPSSGNGTAGQFAISDGNGGITWLTVVNGNEVAY